MSDPVRCIDCNNMITKKKYHVKKQPIIDVCELSGQEIWNVFTEKDCPEYFGKES